MLFIILNINYVFSQSYTGINKTESNKVLHLNVAGELFSTTYATLTYIPNTTLSSLNKWPRDNRGRIFLDLSPELFKHFLHQLRRWSIRNNRSADSTFEPPSWEIKDEFNEMLRALGFQKHQQSLLT